MEKEAAEINQQYEKAKDYTQKKESITHNKKESTKKRNHLF